MKHEGFENLVASERDKELVVTRHYKAVPIKMEPRHDTVSGERHG